MNAALLVAAGSLGLFAVALILLCRAAEAADQNRADDLMGLAGDHGARGDGVTDDTTAMRAAAAPKRERDDFRLWKLEIGGQR